MWWACGIQGAHVPCLELLQVVCAGLAPEQEVSLPGMQQYYVSWAKVQRKLMNT